MVLLNPAPMQPLPDELWRLADILSPNQVEAAQLLQLPGEISAQNAFQALEQLRQRGISYPLITLGGEATPILTESSTGLRPAYPVEPVDTTAAGDALWADWPSP